MNYEWTTREKKLFGLARPYLQGMHNSLHTKEVVRFALILLDIAGGDRNIVVPAAILHDVGWSQVPYEQALAARQPSGDPALIRLHEDYGAAIAADILNKVSKNTNEIEEIIRIIERHDTRAYALSKNDRIVKDADKLSRFGKPFFEVLPKRLLGMSAQAVCESLKEGIETWFFISHSKKIAQKELNDRIKEIEKVP